ncbi:MAG: glutamate--tRNA ligase [Synergistaceae bacterium]|nr:glutamate--tRNA ligase [Synergistaceae bacterium]
MKGNLVRTRFAPSPTGELHIGGARTALFNYLFAKSNLNGEFLLRIDDTDSERSKREYEDLLLSELNWLGLKWDNKPERQSERKNIYDKWLDELKQRGAVYPCFCSEDKLEAMRDAQLAKGEPPHYDNSCRDLPREEVEERIKAGEKFCWRLALPENYIASFDDAVQGHREFAADNIGDFVIYRSDGTPTYVFASAIDDYLMSVTHIIRGDEHIPNTARQIAIIDIMQWPRPVFAHIPMVLSQERKKLGKRTGSKPVREYRERGYLPEAIDAYLATLSWQFESENNFDINKLAKIFKLDDLAKSSPVHDEAHLLYWQKLAMKSKGGDFIARELIKLDERFKIYEDRIALLINDLIDETPFVNDLRDALNYIVCRPEKLKLNLNLNWLDEFVNNLRACEWTPESIEKFLRSFMKDKKLKGREFFHPVRVILTGLEKGAALPLIIYALGFDECAARLKI